MNPALIVDAVRTPVGKVNGVLAGIELEDLLAPLIVALIERNRIDAASIDEVIVGNAAGPGGNPARVALLSAGLPLSVPGMTVDRQCGSGLEAINTGARLIQCGVASLVIAGGAESASTAPLRARQVADPDAPQFYSRARFAPDHIGDPDMGTAAENVASMYGISRARQDEFAWSSHHKALAAVAAGVFDSELVPVDGGNDQTVQRDECPRPDCTLESLAALKPVFRPGGTVTAGNACPINDGAALVLLMSPELWEKRRQSTGLQKSLRFVDSVAAGVDPNLLGIGPVPAVQKLLSRCKVHPELLDQIEFNEAFAAQVLASMDQLQLNPTRVNPAGGALALGHPYGASGAILVTRLLHDLAVGQMGLATLGIGGGMGLASLFLGVE